MKYPEGTIVRYKDKSLWRTGISTESNKVKLIGSHGKEFETYISNVSLFWLQKDTPCFINRKKYIFDSFRFTNGADVFTFKDTQNRVFLIKENELEKVKL